MTAFRISYAADMPGGAQVALVPGGLATAHAACTGVTADTGTLTPLTEATTGQTAYRLDGAGPRVALTFHFDASRADAWPEAMFRPHPSRFTRFAAALLEEAEAAAAGHSGLARATAIACAAAERFTYGHPDIRFNDGLDAVPALGCGLVEGSCVDINTYFLAALRAAGIEAGYVTGFFFPAEKGDHCTDGHCWVVTRIDGATQDWDIAHHLKMGTRRIAPCLNPKPGFRAATFHSMGLDFPELGLGGHKALIEPVAVADGRAIRFDAPTIRLHHPAGVTAPA